MLKYEPGILSDCRVHHLMWWLQSEVWCVQATHYIAIWVSQGHTRIMQICLWLCRKHFLYLSQLHFRMKNIMHNRIVIIWRLHNGCVYKPLSGSVQPFENEEHGVTTCNDDVMAALCHCAMNTLVHIYKNVNELNKLFLQKYGFYTPLKMWNGL